MKSLMYLWQRVLAEAGTLCGISTDRDLETVTGRVEREGFEFLSITLPQYCADFERSLDAGEVCSDGFVSFARYRGIPKLFGGFLSLVFDNGTGRLLDDPSIEAIRCLRQLTLMMGKIDLPCSDVRVEKALKGYIECDQQVAELDALRSPSLVDEFRKMSKFLWTDILTDVDQAIYYLDVVPKHGPGATADRLTGNRKYELVSWTERLEEIFPAGVFLLPNLRMHAATWDRVTWREPGAEIPVKVITVPKTQKTPRIIAVEPACMQYAQQAVSEKLVNTIESTRVGWVKDHQVYNSMKWYVGFEDQVPNQRLAREGSQSGTLATLDLSEASDRVSWSLVSEMAKMHPWFFRALDATRSRRASVRGHGVISLSKYASMGSALCFPVEAMVFTTIVMLGIQDALNRQLTRRDVNRVYKGRVRVYGDDIVIPVESVPFVVSRLEAFGLKVNFGKSFWTGKFRESCGKEYYDGHDVSIVRVRRKLPARRSDVDEVISLVSLRNQLYRAGWWSTVFNDIDPHLEDLFGGHYPVVGEQSPVLGRFSFLGNECEKWDKNLHIPLVRGYVVRSQSPSSILDSEGALLKWFLKRGEEPFADRNHLERQGRPDAVYTKLRWRSAL